MQKEFEREFEYPLTRDQAQAVIDVKNGAASMDVKVPQYGALLLQLHKIIWSPDKRGV